MLIELPAEIEDSVKAQALMRGLSVEAYLRDVVERDLRLGGKSGSPHHPLKSGWGLCADLGPAPSAEEIDANRAEMFRGFGGELLISAAAVADTHAAIWYLFADPRLSTAARSAFDQAGFEGRKVLVSAITLVEMVYLAEKGRIPQEVYDRLRGALADPEHVLVEAPLTGAIAESMRRISREQVPDMPDRIVAATALSFHVPPISRDRRILASDLTTIW